MKLVGKGITFEDISVVPIGSKVPISEINIQSKVTKKIKLNSPIVSSSMKTVTNSKMAIAIARQGGIGIISHSLSIENQASEVDKVKRSENGVITDPFSLSPNNYVYEADQLIAKFKISGVPIVESGLLVGIITNRDLRFEEDHNKKIYEVMTQENLITAPIGTTLEEAKKILMKTKVEKLPLVDEDFNLKGLITIKDIQKPIKYPNSAKDEQGRLIVGASVKLDDEYEKRIEKLIDAKVDVLFIEETNNYSEKICSIIKEIKAKYSDIQIVAGNVVTGEGTKTLIEAGADGIKVGIGSGSVNVTRIITGIGVPQITAIENCYEVAKEYGVPIISDGAIKYPGDVLKALAVGASCCVLGQALAGCEETPGDIILYRGRKYKEYTGADSENEISKKDKIVVETTVDARVPYRGPVTEVLQQFLNGFKTGMSYVGAKNIEILNKNGKYIELTSAASLEGNVNNVIVTKESTNFSLE